MHWPIAFLSTAYALDAVYGATTYLRLPFLTNNLSSSLGDISRGSHWLQIFGIITAIPSVMSGSQQLVQIVKNGGLYEADGKTIRTKVKITLAHAAANDVVLFASIYNWYTRRSEKMLAPDGLNIAISCIMLPLLLWSANLGGTLVYNYGTGLNIGSKNKKN